MDMSEFNNDIAEASEEPINEGPRFPDGRYLMAVLDHEDKLKYPEPSKTKPGEITHGQIGLWVTFRIYSGEYQGKDYRKYYGIKHPTSKPCVRYGQAGLKKLYRAVNFMPATFEAIYGRRFVATLESKKQDDEDFPWSTDIIEYEAAPEPKGQSFQETMAKAANSLEGTVIQVPANFPKVTIDEIPF